MLLLTAVCENPNILRVIYFMKLLLNFIFIVIQIALILMLSFDLFRTVMSGESNGKSTKVIVKRILACVCAFCIFTFVSFLLKFFSFTSLADCYNNASLDKISYYQDIYNDEHPKTDDPKVNVSLYKENKYKIVEDGENADFLTVAERVWKLIASGNYVYGGSSIPAKNGRIDCSGYVSWVLYEYGYKDYEGWQHTTVDFLNENYTSKYGWTVIDVAAGEDVTNKLQPGDILVRGSKTDAGAAGHVNIVVKVENGITYAYDCGSASSWKNSGGNPVDKSYFSKGASGTASKSGRIIRVKKPSSN